MTREEAVIALEKIFDVYDEIHESSDGDDGYKEMTALRMAIEALSQPIVAKRFDIQSGYIYCSPEIAENVKVVVRCKDCKHRSDGGWCDVYIQPRMETDFCNHGERQCNYFGERREP